MSLWSAVPIEVPEEPLVRKEREPKIVNSAPIMPLEKPIVTDVDYLNIDLSWSPASLPPNSTPTSFTCVLLMSLYLLIGSSA